MTKFNWTFYKIMGVLTLISLLVTAFYPLAFSAIIICLGIIFLAWSWNCPNCKKVFARKHTHTEVLDRYTKYVDVQHKVHHKNSRGEIVKTTTYNKTKPIAMRKVRSHYKCNYCGHTWAGSSKHIRADGESYLQDNNIGIAR